MSTPTSTKNSALEKYAELMIQKINQVSNDWSKPWFSDVNLRLPKNLSGHFYSNYNKLLLYLLGEKEGYRTPIYMTFNQAKEANLSILKGSKAFPVSFFSSEFVHKDTKKSINLESYKLLSNEEKANYKNRIIGKTYLVFNLDQTDFAEKFPEKWEKILEEYSTIPISSDSYRNSYIENTIKNQSWFCPINLIPNSTRAFYSPTKDNIVLPLPEQFFSRKDFYYAALHEMAHSTRHKDRLNRSHEKGRIAYGHEELIAEFSAAVVGKDLGLEVLPPERERPISQGLDGAHFRQSPIHLPYSF